jgi:hypothetical protein
LLWNAENETQKCELNKKPLSTSNTNLNSRRRKHRADGLVLAVSLPQLLDNATEPSPSFEDISQGALEVPCTPCVVVCAPARRPEYPVLKCNATRMLSAYRWYVGKASGGNHAPNLPRAMIWSSKHAKPYTNLLHTKTIISVEKEISGF